MQSKIKCIFLAGFLLVGCDPERKKQCEWTLEPDSAKLGKTEPGFIPVCARNWVSRKQDCRLETTLPFTKEVTGKKFRYVDMTVASVAIPRKIQQIRFCDGTQQTPSSTLSPATAQQRAPVVQPEWKKKSVALFEASPSTAQAWGLLSSSGWADNGQYFILQKSPTEPAVLYYAAPGASAWAAPQPISSAEWQIFRQGIGQAISLPPFFSAAFDGVEYDFFMLYKEGDKTQTRTLYMNNPAAFPAKAIQYNQLVEQFFALAKKKQLR